MTLTQGAVPQWRDISTGKPPEGQWVLGYYPADPWAPVWTVRRETYGGTCECWFGDHHSSDTATERPPPIAWLPLPSPPEQP